jgi:hypothetical protein
MALVCRVSYPAAAAHARGPTAQSSMNNIQPIRPAATVILARDAAGGYEIFMLRRTSAAAFAGGMFVFPAAGWTATTTCTSTTRTGRARAQRSRPSRRRSGRVARLLDRRPSARASRRPAAARLRRLRRSPPLRRDPHVNASPATGRRCTRAQSAWPTSAAGRPALAVDRIHFFNRFVTPGGPAAPVRYAVLRGTRRRRARPGATTSIGDRRQRLDLAPRGARAQRRARVRPDAGDANAARKPRARFVQGRSARGASPASARFPVHRPHVPVDL